MEKIPFRQMLQEAWANFLHFLPAMIAGFVALLVFIFLAGIAERLLRRIIKRSADDPLIAHFFGRIAQVIVVLMGIVLMMSIWGFGHLSDKLLAGAGILTFVVGFALQDIGKNFLSGVVMAFSSPFKIGNVIETQGLTGTVQEMTLRQTRIKTFDGRDVYIPNASILNNPLQNYTIDGYMRYDFVVGVDYGSDLEKAVQLTTEVLLGFEEVAKNDGKTPLVFASRLASSAVELTVHYWIFLPGVSRSILAVKSDIIIQVLNALNQAGFYIPTSVVEIKNYPLSQ